MEMFVVAPGVIAGTNIVADPDVGRNASYVVSLLLPSLAALRSNWIFETAVEAEVFCTEMVRLKVSPAYTTSGSVLNPVTMILGVDTLSSLLSSLGVSSPAPGAPLMLMYVVISVEENFQFL